MTNITEVPADADDFEDFEFDLGEEVTMRGRIVGRSEFLIGGDSYLIEFGTQGGRTKREWVVAELLDIATDGDTND